MAWQNRAQFFGVAAEMMRRILVDHARARGAAKRPDGGIRVALAHDVGAVNPPASELLMIDDALRELAALDARQARLVALRYFGGLSESELGAVLSLSRRTVTREWQSARAWLFRRMIRAPGRGNAS